MPSLSYCKIQPLVAVVPAHTSGGGGLGDGGGGEGNGGDGGNGGGGGGGGDDAGGGGVGDDEGGGGVGDDEGGGGVGDDEGGGGVGDDEGAGGGGLSASDATHVTLKSVKSEAQAALLGFPATLTFDKNWQPRGSVRGPRMCFGWKTGRSC